MASANRQITPAFGSGTIENVMLSTAVPASIIVGVNTRSARLMSPGAATRFTMFPSTGRGLGTTYVSPAGSLSWGPNVSSVTKSDPGVPNEKGPSERKIVEVRRKVVDRR